MRGGKSPPEPSVSAAVSTQNTRTLAEIPWLSLLPPEQRARLEAPYEDPDGDQWDALVAADRSLEADFLRPSNVSRIVKPLAAAAVAGGAVGATLLLLTPSETFEKLAPWLIGLAWLAATFHSESRFTHNSVARDLVRHFIPRYCQ